MKQIFKKTNRFLAAFLAVAMVLTMLPISQATTWADDDVSIIENTDGSNTEVEKSEDIEAPEEVPTEDITPVQQSGSDDPGEGEAEEIDSDKSDRDVEIWMVKPGDATDHIVVYQDGIGSNYKGVGATKLAAANTPKYVTTTSYAMPGETAASTHDSRDMLGGTKDYATSATNFNASGNDTQVLNADSDNDFVFYVEPSEGYTWVSQNSEKSATDEVKDLLTVVYTNYNNMEDTAVPHYDEVETEDGKSYVTVSDVDWNDQIKKVTVSDELLKKVITASKTKSKNETTNEDIYKKAVLAIKFKALSVVAWKTLPEIEFIGGAGKQPLPSARTFAWTDTPTNAAHAKTITISSTETVSGKTLSADMFKITYTANDGSGTTEYTVNSSVSGFNADPEHGTKASRGTVGGAYVNTTGVFSIDQKLMNVYIKGAGNLVLSIDTSKVVSKVYGVTLDYNPTYVSITKADGAALENTIDAAKTSYSFKVTPVKTDYKDRSVSSIKVETNTESLSVISGLSETTNATITGSATAGFTVTVNATGMGVINDAITISAETFEDIEQELDSGNVTLYNSKGAVLSSSDAVSGKALVFEARPVSGKEIDSVQYYFGKNTTQKTTLTASGGVYTIPAVTDTVTIIAKAKDSEIANDVTVLPAETRIYSVFKGTGHEYAAYWDNLYGTSYYDSDDVTTSGPQTTAGQSIVAITFEVGADVVNESVNFGIWDATNATALNTNSKWLAGAKEPRVGRTDNTKGDALVTIFCDNSDFTTYIDNDTDEWKLQAFTIPKSVYGNGADATVYANRTLRGSVVTLDSTAISGANAATGAVINTDYSVTGFTAGTTNAGEVGNGQEYFFTIIPAANKSIESVKYAIAKDAASIGDWVVATPAGGTGVYKTAAATNNVFISVKVGASVTIEAPDNTKVTADFAKAGETTTVPQANDFYFTLNHADNVKITKVTVGTSDGETDVKSDLKALSDGSYKIEAASLNNSLLYIDAKTEETVSASAYTATWAIDGETGDTEFPVLSGAVGSQSITLGVGEESDVSKGSGSGELSVSFNKTNIGKDLIKKVNTGKNDTKDATSDRLVVASYVLSGTKATENIVSISNGTTPVITANKIGEDKILAKYEVADGDNTLVYSSELPVSVKAPFEDVKVIATGKTVGGAGDTYKTSDVTEITTIKAVTAGTDQPGNSTNLGVQSAIFTLVGVNSRTKQPTVLKSGSNGVTISGWSFTESTADDAVKTKKMYDGTTANTAYSSWMDEYTSGTGSLVWVAGSEAATGITVSVNVQQAGETKPKAIVSDPVNVVESGIYGLYPTLTINSGEKVEGTNGTTGVGGSSTGVSGVYALEKSGSMNGAELTLDLYETETAFGSSLTTSTLRDTAINQNVIKKSTKSVTYKTSFDSNNIAPDKSEYLKVTENAGKFTITVNNAPATGTTGTIKLSIDAIIDGVLVSSQDVSFTVVNSKPKATVYLKLNDETTKSNDKVVAQKLTATYYTAKKNTIVEKNNNVPSLPDADGGIKFTNETVGSNFVLPVQADFDSTLIGKGRVLVAWHNGSTYYYPGETVTVPSAGLELTPDWKDEFVWATPVTGSDSVKGAAIYNGNVATKDSEGKIISYTVFAKDGNGDGTFTDSGDAVGEINNGGSVPVVLWLRQNNALTADKSGVTSDGALETKVQTDYFVSGTGITLSPSASPDWTAVVTAADGVLTAKAETTTAQKVVASWTSEAGVTYTSTPLAFNVLPAPGYTLVVDTSKTEFLVDQAGAYIGADLKAGSSSTSVPNGAKASYTYTWSSSDKTVAEIEDCAAGAPAGTAKSGYGKLTLKKAGTTNIGLTVKDQSGIEVSAAAVTITVSNSNLVVKLIDGEGKEADRIYAKASTAGVTDATDYMLSFSTKTGLNITSTINAIAADDVYVNATGSKIDASTNKITVVTKQTDADGSWTAASPGIALSDEGRVTLGYSYNGTNFEKKIPVSTYYALTLSESDNNAYITKDGKALGKVDDNTSATIKVTTANQKISGNGSATNPYVASYENISLADYGAVYVDEANPKELAGWNADANAATTPIYTSEDGIAKLAATATSTGNLNAGAFVLKPAFKAQSLTKATLTKNTITLSNEVAKTGHLTVESSGSLTTVGDEDYAKVEITVEPYASQASLTLKPDKVNFYGLNASGVTSPTSADNAKYTTQTGDSFAVAYNAPSGTTQTRTFYVAASKSGKIDTAAADVAAEGRRAGTTTVKVMCGENQLGSFTINVNGYDTKEDVYYQDGEIVKNAAKTVVGETWYFGPDGKRIKDDGMLELEDDSIILIIGGKVASEGKHDYTDKDGVNGTYYVDKDGKILKGWITKAGAVTTDAAQGVYYADPANKGAIVVSALKEVNGTMYYFNGNAEKEVAAATTAAGNYAATSDGKYYVNTSGEVAMNGIKKVNDVNRLFTAEGKIITYADTVTAGTAGKYTVNNVVYVIDQTTNEAKPDHTEHTWVYQGMDWDGFDFLTASGDVYALFACEEGKEEDTVKATVITEVRAHEAKEGDEEDVSYTITRFAATAALDPSGKAAKGAEGEEYKKFIGGAMVDSSKAEFDALANEEEGEETGEITAAFASDVNWAWDEEEGEQLVGKMYYTGQKLTPAVVVKNGSKVLTEGEDYSVAYQNNVKVANSKPTQAVITGKGNYTTKFNLPFEIIPAPIGWAVAGNNKYDSTKKPAPILIYEGTKLNEGAKKDYVLDTTIIENEDESPLEGYEDGTYVKVTGVNNFNGTSYVEVKAVAKTELKPIKITLADVKNITYDGQAHYLSGDQLIVTDKAGTKIPELVYYDAEGNVTQNEEEADYYLHNYFVDYSRSPVDAGSVKVTVVGTGDYTGTASKTFTIQPNKDSSKMKATFTRTVEKDGEQVEKTDYSFKSTGVTPALIVTNEAFVNTTDDDDTNDEPVVLVAGKDYKISYKNNKKVGDAKTAAEIQFLGNYKGAAKMSKPFKITGVKFNDPEISVVTTAASEVSYVSGKKFSTAAKQATAYLTVDGVQLKTSEYTTKYYEATVDEDGNPTIKDVDIAGFDGAVEYVKGTEITKTTTLSKDQWIIAEVTPKKAEQYDATGATFRVQAPIYLTAGKDNTHDLTKAKIKVVAKDTKKKIGYTGKPICFDRASYGEIDPDTGKLDEDGEKAYAARQADIQLAFGKSIISEADFDKYFDAQYVNNVQKGTATIIISAKRILDDAGKDTNPYAGTAIGTFKITQSVIEKTMTKEEQKD